MTPEQAELKYRLAKLILQSMQQKALISRENVEYAREALCEKYHPFTYCLEVDHPWPNEP
jgi:hypothetical protein